MGREGLVDGVRVKWWGDVWRERGLWWGVVGGWGFRIDIFWGGGGCVALGKEGGGRGEEEEGWDLW